MGFIDYNGTKEDRFAEVVDYSRALQEEDWKRKREIKIERWLRDLTGSSSFSRLNVVDLLKYIIAKYRSMQTTWKEIIAMMKCQQRVDPDQLWQDFSTDLAVRHLSPFHLTPDKRDKYLQAFQDKVFKLEESISAKQHYRTIAVNTDYRDYFVECFDPTWKGRHFFKYLYSEFKTDLSGLRLVDKFLDSDRQLNLLLGLYLYQVILPYDDIWMAEVGDEYNSLSDIMGKIHRSTLTAPELRYLINPLHLASVEELMHESQGEKDTQNEEQIYPDNFGSGLDKELFNQLIKRGKMTDYIEACNLLLACDLPNEIRQVYRQLVERIPILEDAANRFDDIFHADLDQFEEYYAPETLKITAVYLDYQAAGPSKRILDENRDSVFLAVRKLLQVVNEKIDEIYRFVMIDANAEAKAVETLMSQDGYVDPSYRIR